MHEMAAEVAETYKEERNDFDEGLHKTVSHSVWMEEYVGKEVSMPYTCIV